MKNRISAVILIFACHAFTADFSGLALGNSWKYYQVWEWGGIWSGGPDMRYYNRWMTVTDSFMQGDTLYWCISVKDSGRIRVNPFTNRSFKAEIEDTCYVVNNKVYSSNLGPNFNWTQQDSTDTTVTIRLDTINNAVIKDVRKYTSGTTDNSVSRLGIGLLHRKDLTRRSSYRYWDEIWLREFNGTRVDTLGDSISIERNPAKRAAQTLLLQNQPNPFNRMTAIRFTVPADLNTKTCVQLCVYTMHGQLVKALTSGVKLPGSYTVSWDGCNGSGQMMPSGVYAVQLRIDRELKGVKRIVFIR
jgi:hypothetical protein